MQWNNKTVVIILRSWLGNTIIIFVIKVARVVNLKLAFKEWFFYNLIIQIKLYKIPYLNLDKTLLFLTNQVICLKNFKLWRARNTVKFNIFLWNFAHVSYLMMSTKQCSGFFKFCLDLEFTFQNITTGLKLTIWFNENI